MGETITPRLAGDWASVEKILRSIQTDLETVKSNYNLLRASKLSGTAMDAGIAVATTVTRFQTTAAISFEINGMLYSKAITDNIVFSSVAVQAINTDCYYILSLNAAGNAAITKGEELATGGTILCPATPADQAIIGGFKMETAAATFQAGVDDLDGSVGTITWYDAGGVWNGVSRPSIIGTLGTQQS